MARHSIFFFLLFSVRNRLLAVVERGKPEDSEKILQSKDENQQLTIPTYDVSEVL